MFKVSVLASGSKGNCTLVKTEDTKILIDAGLSGKKIIEAIQSINLSEEKIQGVLISHEHSDHIQGAGIICRRLKVPLYISEDTFIAAHRVLGDLKYGVKHFKPDEEFRINDILITPFSSSHDAVESCNFIIRKSGKNNSVLGIATDLGYATKLTCQRLKGVTTLILESNHDEKMLINGPYSWELKQRVKSKHGHLSNIQAAGLIEEVIHGGLKNLVLAHLSEQNNTPELAFENMRDALIRLGHPVTLYVSSQYQAMPLLDI